MSLAHKIVDRLLESVDLTEVKLPNTRYLSEVTAIYRSFYQQCGFITEPEDAQKFVEFAEAINLKVKNYGVIFRYKPLAGRCHAAAYNYKTGWVVVFIPWQDGILPNPTDFETGLEHELVHREQYRERRRKGVAARQRHAITNTEQGRRDYFASPEGRRDYFASPDEIGAYAYNMARRVIQRAQEEKLNFDEAARLLTLGFDYGSNEASAETRQRYLKTAYQYLEKLWPGNERNQ